MLLQIDTFDKLDGRKLMDLYCEGKRALLGSRAPLWGALYIFFASDFSTPQALNH